MLSVSSFLHADGLEHTLPNLRRHVGHEAPREKDS